MSGTVSVDSDRCVVSRDAEIGALVFTWREEASDEAFRRPSRDVASLLEERAERKLLTDCRQLGQVSMDDLQWAAEEWVPLAVDGGIEYLAVVYPEDTIGQLNMDSVARSDSGREAAFMPFFTDEMADARRWLRVQ